MFYPKLHALHGSKYFAKIDAKSGFFFQLPLAAEFRYITTIIAPRGCYRLKRTPFGLTCSDASEAFQKMMNDGKDFVWRRRRANFV